MSDSIFMPILHLKDAAKEEKDFKILDRETFEFLAERYGCENVMRRRSVAV